MLGGWRWGTLVRFSSIDAVMRFSCVRASGQPAAGSRLDHRRFSGLLFLLRSAVSCKRSPILCVLLATGIRNIAAEQDKITGSYRTTVIARLVAVLAPDVTASFAGPLAQHSRACGLRPPGARALAALFLAVLRTG
jgi:hypothetical protein